LTPAREQRVQSADGKGKHGIHRDSNRRGLETVDRQPLNRPLCDSPPGLVASHEPGLKIEDIMVQLLGKDLWLTGDDPPTTYNDLALHLHGLCARDGLRALGSAYSNLAAMSAKVQYVDGVPIAAFAIPPLALELILSGDDAAQEVLDDARLARLVRCFHSLPEPSVEADGAFEYLLRMGQAQFSFQGRDPYRLARMVSMFRDTWQNTPEAAQIDISQATMRSFGLDLESTLLFGFAFSGRAAKDGYVAAYPGDMPDHKAARLFSKEAQGRFLRALSASYDEVRQDAKGSAPPDALRKYRFNPLVIHPLVRPDRQPPGAEREVFVVPCHKFLIDRISDGLVFDCRARHGAAFNDAFGHVFEQYVGGLLRRQYGDENVRGDFVYRVGKNKVRSPDWTVFSGSNAVVFEVKKSILYPKSRSYGRLEDVRNDIKGTLQKAIHQLTQFRKDLGHLRDYPSRQDVELVVVTWDDAWWANWILMRQVSVPPDIKVHVVSIHDLERLLALCPSPSLLHQALWSKRNADTNSALVDMSDWLSRNGGAEDPGLPSLKCVHQEFSSRWNLDWDPVVPTTR
jgi:hypothetical protein